MKINGTTVRKVGDIIAGDKVEVIKVGDNVTIHARPDEELINLTMNDTRIDEAFNTGSSGFTWYDVNINFDFTKFRYFRFQILPNSRSDVSNYQVCIRVGGGNGRFIPSADDTKYTAMWDTALWTIYGVEGIISKRILDGVPKYQYAVGVITMSGNALTRWISWFTSTGISDVMPTKIKIFVTSGTVYFVRHSVLLVYGIR
jgi:hypothetical protein